MSLISLAGGSWWYEIWISLWLLICQGIYIFIGALYQVFEKVASVNLFSADVFTEITSRIYIVMGIAMLFIFAYNLVLMIINPDEKKGSNNQMSKMVKETIISLTLLVLLPLIFNWMYIFQTHVLESNIIGQVILGDVGTTQGDYSKCDSDDYECKCDFSQFEELEKYKGKVKILFGLISWNYNQDHKKESLETACKKYRENLTPSQRGAYSVSPILLSAFYRPTNFNYNDCEDYLLTGSSSLITNDEDKQICINFYYDVNFSKYTGNISAFSNDSYLKDIISDFDKDSMEFQWLMATVAGVLAVYMFFCYSMEIGVRVAKLGFLQLISPIPVMMRIIPGQKEKVFDKWLTNLKNTYMDVFIRLIIIFFSLFAISLVPEVMDTLLKSTNGSSGGNFLVRALASVFVILGILKFAGDAPALFKEFFGGAGSFALRSPAKQIADNKLAMGGLGMAAGGAQNAIGNYYQATHDKDGNKLKGKTGEGIKSAVGGFFGGARRGAVHGAKAKDWDSFKHEMKQSKYETDRARKRRLDDKQIAENHGYDESMLQGFIGSQIRRDKALLDHLITDGSGKVEANAASGLFQKLEAVEGTFKNASIGDIENIQKELLNSIRGGKKDDVSFAGRDYKYNGNGQWIDKADNNKTYNENDMMDRIKEYVTDLKRNQYAENYGKNIGALKAGMETMITGLKDSFSTLGKDFETNLFTHLNKIAKDNRTLMGEMQIESVEDLQTAINTAITRFNDTGDTRNLGFVYDLFDKVKSDTKAVKGETALRDSIQESKKSS